MFIGEVHVKTFVILDVLSIKIDQKFVLILDANG
jgi:hypothetical protein